MTLLPARRLESAAPDFRRKGRIQIGADADITVFDPATVIDRATYADAFQPSSGIVHVLVNGVPVVRGGVLRSNVFPGRMLTGGRFQGCSEMAMTRTWAPLAAKWPIDSPSRMVPIGSNLFHCEAAIAIAGNANQCISIRWCTPKINQISQLIMTIHIGVVTGEP